MKCLRSWALIILIVLSLSIMTSLIGCSESSTAPETSEGEQRIGAVCNDGTRSTATGQGACSHHGGVDYWLYK